MDDMANGKGGAGQPQPRLGGGPIKPFDPKTADATDFIRYMKDVGMPLG